MNRRAFLKAAVAGAVICGVSPEAMAGVLSTCIRKPVSRRDSDLGNYFAKMKRFDRLYPDDIYLDSERFHTLKASLLRLKRLQKTVGYGNFHLLSFDDALKIGRSYVRVGRFTKDELDFVEWVFYEDASHYGFLGRKPLTRLTDRIHVRKVTKISRTGHFLYKGRPLTLYNKMKKDVGKDLVLTSGVRSIVKQTLLFLNKAAKNSGNLSLASRSLAPPGFSYHGIGDFDVGQVGFGVANFSERFATTDVFKRLQKLGYVKLRYTSGNLLGVRFEPWHIHVDASLI